MSETEIETKPKRKHIEVTAKVMKIYSAITLGMYLLAESVFMRGILHSDAYSSAEFQTLLSENPDVMSTATFASILEILGGLCIPVLAFLLVEGFMHTGSFTGYLKRILLFAVISVVPYSLAMSGKVFDSADTNLFVSLAIALVMLYGLRLIQTRTNKIVRILLSAVIIFAAVLWTLLFNSQFGMVIVLLCAVYYLLYDNKGLKVLLGCAVSAAYVSAMFSGYLLWGYSGKREENTNKYLWYALYPVTLLVFAGITALIG